MPKYRIGSPDGKTWEVNAPDGATQEEVLAYAQSQWKTPQLSGAAAIPRGEGDMAGPAAPVETPGAKLLYGLNNIAGAGEAGLSVASAIPASVYGMMAGGGAVARSGQYGTPEGARLMADTAAQSIGANTYQPRTQAGREQLGSVSSALQNLLPVAGLGGEMAALSQAARPAIGAASDATGAAMGKAGDALIRGKVDPQVAGLAQVAEKYGIPLSPHMLGTNKFARMVGNAAEQDVPLAFSKVKDRQAQFNKAVLTQMNAENTATRATPDAVVAAMDRSGSGIGDIAAKTSLPVTPEITKSITDVVNSAKDYGSDVHRLVSARARDLGAIVDNGVVDGTAFKKWNTNVLQDIRNSEGTTQATLGKLQEVAMNAFEKTIKPEDLPAWKQYRKEYAIGKQLMPILAKSPIGDISPSSLMQAVTRGKDAQTRMAYGQGGDLGELAKIGQQFLKEPGMFSIPERAAGYGLLGGAAAFGGSPALAAGAGWTGASLYNLLGPSIVRSLTKAKENVKPLAPELTTSRGFQEMPKPTPESLLGDLTPNWQTSLGAAGPRPEGIDARGLFPALGDPRVGESRLQGRPQMPVQPGLPGLSDTAISGFGARLGTKAPKPFTDIAEGALPGMKVGPKQSGIQQPWSATAGDAIQRLLAKPTDRAGVELSARIMKILNEPNKGVSIPDQIMAILNENKGHTLSKQIMAILREYSPDTPSQAVSSILRG